MLGVSRAWETAYGAAEAMIRKYIEPLGWVAIALLVALVAWLFLRGGGA